MSFDSTNEWLMNVMEYGPDSFYSKYYDINWDHYSDRLRGKVLSPMIGNLYGQTLENGEIKLTY